MEKVHKSTTALLCLVLAIVGGCASTGNMKEPDRAVYEPRAAEFREQIYDREVEFALMDADSDGNLAPGEYNGTTRLFLDMDADSDGNLSPLEASDMITFVDIPSGSFAMGLLNLSRRFSSRLKTALRNTRSRWMRTRCLQLRSPTLSMSCFSIRPWRVVT